MKYNINDFKIGDTGIILKDPPLWNSRCKDISPF